MVNIDDIFKSIQEKITAYKKEYNDITQQMVQITNEYTGKIKKLQEQAIVLQEEGNKKISVLNEKRAQSRGKYIALEEQYKEFVDNRSGSSEDSKVTEVGEQIDKRGVEDVVTSEDIVPSTSSQNELSPEELAKLSEITEMVEDRQEKKRKPFFALDIPEYLQDEYKK